MHFMRIGTNHPTLPSPDDLWSLVSYRPQIDPAALATAVESQISSGDLDSRTLILIRDSVKGLEEVWGAKRFGHWLAESAFADEIRQILVTQTDPPGFPSLARRLMDRTKPETVAQFLRELGARIHQPARVYIGGSISLILSAGLSRHTEDIDLVDEVPAPLRNEHELLDELSARYGLRLAHFQSHFLPAGWESRARSYDKFGPLEVYLVDPYDVLVGKLMSNRGKDRDDLRLLLPQLDPATLTARLPSASALLNEPALKKNAVENWYIIFGQPLPYEA
jgi:hypothetical protein